MAKTFPVKFAYIETTNSVAGYINTRKVLQYFIVKYGSVPHFINQYLRMTFRFTLLSLPCSKKDGKLQYKLSYHPHTLPSNHKQG